MYPNSTDFKQLMAQAARELTVRGSITFFDSTVATLSSADIASFTVSESAGSQMLIGGTSASTVVIRLDNRAGEWEKGGSRLGSRSLDGTLLKLEIGVQGDNGYIYAPIGEYILEKAVGNEQETTIEIRGADALANKTNKVFFDDETKYPRTIKAILADVCTRAGITAKTQIFTNENVSIATMPQWQGANCRDIIGYIAACAGGFARIDRDGKLEIVRIENTVDYTLAGDRYLELKSDATSFGPFNAVIVQEHGAPYGTEPLRVATEPSKFDTGLNSVTISANPLFEYGAETSTTIANGILAALSGITFDGGNIRWQGDPSLTVGDTVEITNLAGNKLKLLIMEQSLEFDGGFVMESGNSISAETSKGFGGAFTPSGKINLDAFDGKIHSGLIEDGAVGGGHIKDATITNAHIQDATITRAKISEAAVESLSADALDAVKARINELVAGSITTDQLYVDLAAIAIAQITTANIDQANISWASINALTSVIASIANTQIGTAHIDYAKIVDMVTQTAIITTGTAGQLYIARLAVTDANMVQLTAGKIMLKAANGNFVQLIADGQGGVTTQTVQVAGDNIANSTISGGKLIEDTITARELNVQSILADSALIGAIKAANIDVANLFAASATISELDSYIIRTNTINAIKGQLSLWADEKINLAVVAAVNDIDVGGRNYVLNSDWSQGALVRWSKNANLAGLYFDQNESFKIENKQAFILACNPNTEGIMSQYIDIKCVEDSSMILSFFLRTNDTNLTRYNSQNPLIASLEGIDNNSTVLFWKGIHFYTEYRTDLQSYGFYKFVFPFTCPAGLTQLRLYLRISSNSADYENWAGYQMIQIEKGTKVTPWKPAVEDPSSGLKSSHITIKDDRIDIATGGKLNATGAEVNIKAGSSMNISSGGDFNLSAGTGDIGVGISTTDQQKFLWGGAGTGMGYPKFYVARDGSYMVFAGLAINELSNAQGIPYSVYISPLSYSSLINLHSYQFVNINKQSYDSSTGTWGAVTSVVVGLTDGLVNISQNLYVDNNVSALTFTDRTPFYRGNALRDIKMITSDSDGNIIHSSLPKCARVNIRSLKEEAKKRLQQNKTTRTKGTGKIDGVQVVQETFIEDDYEITEGRDLSVMVSMLTVAVKQLTEIVEKQQTQIDSLLEQQTSRQSIARK